MTETASYEIYISADVPGYTYIRLDLTPDEAALLTRVGERLGEASHGDRGLTVIAQMPKGPTR